MSKKVIGAELGIPNYAARCKDCDWTFQDYRNRRKGVREIKKHVIATGHTVRLEKGVITEYALEVTE